MSARGSSYRRNRQPRRARASNSLVTASLVAFLALGLIFLAAVLLKHQRTMAASFMGRMPTLYVPHGGGPLPLLGDPSHASLITFLKGLHKTVPQPKAILVGFTKQSARALPATDSILCDAPMNASCLSSLHVLQCYKPPCS